MSTADPSGLADPLARAALRRHLVSAAEATGAAVGLAMLGRHLDALDLDSEPGALSGWTPYARDCLMMAIEILAAAAHHDVVEAGRADGFDIEHGFVDQRTAPAATCAGEGA